MTRPKLLPAVLATATLVQIFILTGCGQGLTGQATGESAGEIEGLKREISSISEGLTELTDQIEQIEEAINVLDVSVSELSSSLDNMSEKPPHLRLEETSALTSHQDHGMSKNPSIPTTPSGSAGLPASLTVAVDSGQGWGGWGNGTYTRCTGVPCGALDVSTWNGEAIYVKPSGVTSDPTHDWYWAYIDKFRPSGYFEVWTIAYVAPRFDASDPDCARDDGWCWNVHGYCVGGCSDPWGDWGDLTVTANY